MYFTEPLIRGIFVQRYKRFFVDAVIYDTGEQVVAHCANPGAMTGLCIPGATVWLLKNDDPKRKLKYTWEFIELLCGTLVGVNTMTPNRIVQNVLEQGGLSVFSQYRTIKREVQCRGGSRLDFLLTQTGLPCCYLEVKNVHLVRKQGVSEFPDSVTKRGTKHLESLSNSVRNGDRAALLYVVQRNDCRSFKVAEDIDKEYGKAYKNALEVGVEMFAVSCKVIVHEDGRGEIKVETMLTVSN